MIKEAYDHPLHATRDLPRQSKPFRPHLKGRNNFLRLLLMYIVIWKKQIFLKKHLPLISPERFSFPPRRRDANTPDFCSCHRYARGLKPTVGILPPLTRFHLFSCFTVGCVHASGVRFTHGWSTVAPKGLKLGVLAGRRRYLFPRRRDAVATPDPPCAFPT